MTFTREFKVELTKTGLPALWESGGGMRNSGSAQIIAGPDGSPKRPVFVRSHGSLALGDHALYIIKKGDLIIRTHWSRASGSEVVVYKIVGFRDEEGRRIALAKSTHSYNNGEWEPAEPTGPLAEAVAAAREKMVCYHCRAPHWALQ